MDTKPNSNSDPEQIPLRPPDKVMKLDRMGASYPTRISFMRVLLRRLNSAKVQILRPVWEMDKNGFGRAVYTLQLDGDTYSLVAFSTPLEPDKRTDRVIAEAWDASFSLFDGIPSEQDLERLQANAPLQEAGRFEPSELVLSRANKSMRLFQHVVDRLSQGLQPDPELIGSTGYLMRTTAVYGNGKLGFADRVVIANRPALVGSFQAEMLTVWLIRGFTHDLVEHIANARDPENSVRLAPEVKRNLGIGNSTGLGMAPFLINHAVLLNNWIVARETALARVRAIETADTDSINQVMRLLRRAVEHVEQWNVADPRQMDRIKVLRVELNEVKTLITAKWLAQASPWNALIETSSCWSDECQELIVALVLEPHGHLIDELGIRLVDDVGLRLDPAMKIDELRSLLEDNYRWALDVDFSKPDSVTHFWYTSVEKMEPRLGVRLEEPGADLELPLDTARQARALYDDLGDIDPQWTVARFLTDYPEHRYMARRVQTSKLHPYSEIRDNLIASDCMPLDILRCKLSFFGASKCDPKSNLWTRINMYQGAPLFDEINNDDFDDWWLPVLAPPSGDT